MTSILKECISHDVILLPTLRKETLARCCNEHVESALLLASVRSDDSSQRRQRRLVAVS